jgi:hypothetical protein
MSRFIFHLLLLSTFLLTACANWQNAANECYAAVQRGEERTFQGRTGREACDRYLEQNQRAAAEYRQNMLQLNQQMQQNRRLNCTTQYLGNRAYTNCY